MAAPEGGCRENLRRGTARYQAASSRVRMTAAHDPTGAGMGEPDAGSAAAASGLSEKEGSAGTATISCLTRSISGSLSISVSSSAAAVRSSRPRLRRSIAEACSKAWATKLRTALSTAWAVSSL